MASSWWPVSLQERRTTPIQRLSGGQRKRVSIGAELLTEPGVFFLDEATSGLDPGTESQLMKLLRRLADDGHTVVLITHATKNVMLCDQVTFLARGGFLAYYGPPDEALTYFQVADFDGIYERLEGESTPEAWATRYLESSQYARFVTRRLESRGLTAGVPPPASGGQAGPTARRSSGPRQFAVLTRRYLDIIRRDRVNLALLFLLAPVLALIDLVAWGGNVLAPMGGDHSQALAMLFLSVLIPFLVGALSSVREIVKESAIYLRERAVSLQIVPYMGSKMAIPLMFAFYHAAALFLVKVLVIDFPNAGGVGLFQFYVTLVLTIVSGALRALLISAITTKEGQSMLLVIGVIVVQVVFSGGVVSLDSLGIAGTVFGSITSTNWAFKALTSSAGLTTDGCSGDFTNCGLPGFSPTERELSYRSVEKGYGGIFDSEVLVAWAAMVANLVGLSVALYLIQKWKDVR